MCAVIVNVCTLLGKVIQEPVMLEFLLRIAGRYRRGARASARTSVRLLRRQPRAVWRYAFATRLDFLTLFGKQVQELKTITVAHATSHNRTHCKRARGQIDLQCDLLARLKLLSQIGGNSTLTDLHCHSFRVDEPLRNLRLHCD